MRRNRFLSALMALALMLCLAACGAEGSGTATPPAEESAPAQETPPAATPAEVEGAELDSGLEIDVMVLNGTTGFGMAPLMSAAQGGETELNYAFSVETDASNVSAALINGDADIAALPTNAAATLYNRTEGEVQLLALNTLGVLYLVGDGSVQVDSVEDLRGQTVYVPAQNPTFIFRHICEQNGLVPGEDIALDNTYAQPAELNAAAASGAVSLAVLPEPMVTIALSKNAQLEVMLDLTAEWDAVAEEGSLVQGCVAVRRGFAEEHPAELAQFLADYGESIELVLSDSAAAAELIAETGVFAEAAVAERAIPNCNLCFITGEEMASAMGEFLNIMYAVTPESIGGALPGEDFYYLG